MRDAAKSVPDVQPGKAQGTWLTASIGQDGLEDEGMLIAAFTGAGTLLGLESRSLVMENVVMRFAKTAMSSLYKQLMSAIGRKLAGSVVESFLWIRMVVAFFHDAGTSLAEKQCLNNRARMRHLGSSRRRCRY